MDDEQNPSRLVLIRLSAVRMSFSRSNVVCKEAHLNTDKHQIHMNKFQFMFLVFLLSNAVNFLHSVLVLEPLICHKL